MTETRTNYRLNTDEAKVIDFFRREHTNVRKYINELNEYIDLLENTDASRKKLLEENKKLKTQVKTLTKENKLLKTEQKMNQIKVDTNKQKDEIIQYLQTQYSDLKRKHLFLTDDFRRNEKQLFEALNKLDSYKH